MAGRVEIFGRKECSFLEVIQETLFEVSAVKHDNFGEEANPNGGRHGVSKIEDSC